MCHHLLCPHHGFLWSYLRLALFVSVVLVLSSTDANSQAPSHVLKGHQFAVRHLAISGDSKVLATSGEADDKVNLWDTVSRKARGTIKIGGEAVSTLAISDDSKWLAVGANDGKIEIWEIKSGKRIHILEAHGEAVHEVIFGHGDNLLFSVGRDRLQRGELIFWDLKLGKERQRISWPDKGGAWCLAVSPDGRFLMSGGDDAKDNGEVKLWDTKTGKERTAFLTGHKGIVSTLAVSPDGRSLALGSFGNDTIRLWELKTYRLKGAVKAHPEGVDYVVFSPDGQHIISVCVRSSELKVWEASKLQHLWTLKSENPWIKKVLFSPNGKALYAGADTRDDGGTILAWDWDKFSEQIKKNQKP